MARSRFVGDAGLTARMTTVMFLLGGLFVVFVVGLSLAVGLNHMGLGILIGLAGIGVAIYQWANSDKVAMRAMRARGVRFLTVPAAYYDDARERMAGVDLPARAIREQIASALDVIVQISRLKDGSRKITNVTEVQGMEGDAIVMQDVFVFEQTGVIEGKIQGHLKPTGIRPKFVEKFEVMGIHLPPGLFGFSF